MPLFLNEKMIQEMRKIQRTKSDKFLKIKHFHKLTLTDKYMQSGRLRASNLSNRYDFEAGYNP